jgi:hypothetical protein
VSEPDSAARRRRSPGRLRDGDDNGAPPVSGTGRGSTGRLQRAGGLSGLLGREAARARLGRGLLLLGCCEAGGLARGNGLV